MKATTRDDPPTATFDPYRSRDPIALQPYQRDVLRLVVRDLLQPEEIPDGTWHDILFGEAQMISRAHLQVLARIAQDLPSALEFWGLGER